MTIAAYVTLRITSNWGDMARKPRVHEIASDLGIDAKVALRALKSMGLYVKGPSSSVEPPVARRLRELLLGGEVVYPVFPSLEGAGGLEAAGLMGALPRRLPQLIDILLRDPAEGAPVYEVMAAAAKQRLFFYVAAKSFPVIERAIGGREKFFQEDDLPGPAGVVMVVRPDTNGDTPTLIAWASVDDVVRVATLALQIKGEREMSRLRPVQMRQTDLVRTAGGYQAQNGTVRLLLSIWASLPERRPSTSSEGETEQREIPTERPEREANTDTQLIYASRSVLGMAERGSGSGVRTGRWSVRGHWRNQWHPSTKEHSRIWIDDHTAGTAAGALVQGERVYLISARQ